MISTPLCAIAATQRRCLIIPTRLRFVLAVASLATGCAGDVPPARQALNLTFLSEGQVNTGAPLKVKVFLLKSQSAFLSAEYPQPQDEPDEAWRRSILGEESLFLLPDREATSLRLILPPEAQYIGLWAEYKTLAGKRWRLLLPPTASGDQKIVATAEGLRYAPVADK